MLYRIMNKFENSWQLVKMSADVLAKDKELLIFPLFSGIVLLVVILSFLLPVFQPLLGTREDVIPLYIFIFYATTYFIINFFNVALVGAALKRLDGGDPTILYGLEIAFARIHKILVYSIIAATVGVILRMLEERSGWLGKFIISLIGSFWSVMTALVVPILVVQNVGPIDAIKVSASTIARTWGENAIGEIGIGFVFTIGYVILFTIAGITISGLSSLQNSTLTFTSIGFFVLLGTGMILYQSALSGVYTAALYRFAMEEESGEFDNNLMHNAFRKR